MIIEAALITIQISLAVICDLYTYKVKNRITFSFAIIAIVYNLSFHGLNGLYFAVLGLIVPFIILFPLYYLRMLGAGDIKLFCSLGALIGLKLIIYSILYSFICGAFIAIAIMLVRKNSLQRLKYFIGYIKNCILCMKLIPYEAEISKSNGSKMHFTVPIAMGTMLTFLLF